METLATVKQFQGAKINQFVNNQPIGYHVTTGRDNWMLTHYNGTWDSATHYPYKATERQMKNQLVKVLKASCLI